MDGNEITIRSKIMQESYMKVESNISLKIIMELSMNGKPLLPIKQKLIEEKIREDKMI